MSDAPVLPDPLDRLLALAARIVERSLAEDEAAAEADDDRSARRA